MKLAVYSKLHILLCGLVCLGSIAGSAQDPTSGRTSPVAAPPRDLARQVEAIQKQIEMLQAQLAAIEKQLSASSSASNAAVSSADGASSSGVLNTADSANRAADQPNAKSEGLPDTSLAPTLANLFGPTSIIGFVDGYFNYNFNHPHDYISSRAQSPLTPLHLFEGPAVNLV